MRHTGLGKSWNPCTPGHTENYQQFWRGGPGECGLGMSSPKLHLHLSRQFELLQLRACRPQAPNSAMPIFNIPKATAYLSLSALLEQVLGVGISGLSAGSLANEYSWMLGYMAVK